MGEVHAGERRVGLVACIVIVLLLGAARPADAQRAEPFSTLTVSAGVGRTANESALRTAWRPGTAVEGRLETPFYAGAVDVLVRYMAYESTRAGITDFDGTDVHLGWHLTAVLPLGVRMGAGVRLGAYRMTFADVPASSNQHSEHEIATALTTRLERELGSGWRLSVMASSERVLLARPVRRVFVGAGLSRTFGTPGWLQEVLR